MFFSLPSVLGLSSIYANPHIKINSPINHRPFTIQFSERTSIPRPPCGLLGVQTGQACTHVSPCREKALMERPERCHRNGISPTKMVIWWDCFVIGWDLTKKHGGIMQIFHGIFTGYPWNVDWYPPVFIKHGWGPTEPEWNQEIMSNTNVNRLLHSVGIFSDEWFQLLVKW